MTHKPKLSAVATFEVLCLWIASARTKDHLKCIENYIESVFLRDYPTDANPLHGELLDSLTYKMVSRDLQPDSLTDVHQMD